MLEFLIYSYISVYIPIKTYILYFAKIPINSYILDFLASKENNA